MGVACSHCCKWSTCSWWCFMMVHDDGTFLPCPINKKNDRKEQFTKIDDQSKHCNYNKKTHEQQKNNDGELTCEHVHIKKKWWPSWWHFILPCLLLKSRQWRQITTTNGTLKKNYKTKNMVIFLSYSPM